MGFDEEEIMSDMTARPASEGTPGDVLSNDFQQSAADALDKLF